MGNGGQQERQTITLNQLQAYIKEKDYRPELKHQYMLKLFEEIGELAEAVRKDKLYRETGQIKGTIDEELYDVLYYVAAIANLYGIDLETSCRLKEQLNHTRYPAKKGE
ncbi:MAG: hypothetical protein K0Q94_3609 [Paenibacillus sp.]|uniref:MazG nucleotide pyrophosphohydrolase domain-containing protein n=1 Tax=Paenibacillus sp. GCM10012303 TaxID=3317340 RepID=UPI0029F3FAF0|nr:hypothetical protein [Paenibacillus sp.]